MKGCVEIGIPLSGNHRNGMRIRVETLEWRVKGPHRCGNCNRPLRAWAQSFNTPEYDEWRKETSAAFAAHYGTLSFEEPVILCVWLWGGKGFMENADWDNLMKCIGDALVDSNVIAPMPWLKALDSGKPRRGEDDVRHIKGHYTRYLTREEHYKMTGGASGTSKDDLKARIFVKLVPASQVEPFGI